MFIIDDIVEAVWTTSTDWAIGTVDAIDSDWARSLGKVMRASRDAVADSIKRQILAIVAPRVVREVQMKWGIVLNPDDPFSRSSISGGLGGKVGIPLRDVFDKDTLLADIGAGLAGQINARVGTAFSSVYPVEMFTAEIENQVYLILNNVIDEMYAEAKGKAENPNGGG